MINEADYIVVGAGSAGAIVASRLAEKGARVVLLEAGRADSSALVRVPGYTPMIHSVPQLKKRVDWGHRTIPQKYANGRRIPMTHGKVLGGSSSINGMLFVRGNRANFDSWAAEGCDGWGYEDVLPAFKRLENFEGGASELRGVGGQIQVTRQKDISRAGQNFMAAAADTFGVPLLDDYNGASQEGVGIFQQSASGGLRYSSSRGYLSDRPMANLQVITEAQVSRVVIEDGRAVGVEILDKSGPQVIRATAEVVVSAGAFGSPQLLMLSGVGPAGHLRDLGIRVHADLPVGQNLHDHLFVPQSYATSDSHHKGTPSYFLSGIIGEATRGNTWFARTVFESAAFVRTSQATDAPDLQLMSLPWNYPAPNLDSNWPHLVGTKPALTVLTAMIYPKSRGELRLASTDPTAAPLIDPAYLSDPADVDLLVEGVAMTREVMANKIIADRLGRELAPGDAYKSETALRRELPNRIHTIYHPVGTCRMGADEEAVVDPRLRVRGIEGLRVADASIMPSITGGNTNAPAMMIGERCAAFIAG